MTNYCVYCHINKINGKRYIGLTGETNPADRWGANGAKYRNSPCFYQAIQKYGWDNFEHVILEFNLTADEAAILEQKYIQLYDTMTPNGYNLTGGGEIKKIISKETRKKLRENHLGKKASDETKKRMSKSRTGHIGYNCKGVWMCDKETHQRIRYFPSYSAAGEFLNKPHAYSHIGKVCKGKYASAYGYFWESAEEGGDDLSHN